MPAAVSAALKEGTIFTPQRPPNSLMSSPEHALVSLLSQFAFSFDGAVLGAALAYAAVRTVLKLTTSRSALNNLREAPYVRVSDLRSVIPDRNSKQSESDQKLVVVRGTVEAKSSVEGSWKSLLPNVLISQESGDRAVIIQRTQMVTPLVFLLDPASISQFSSNWKSLLHNVLVSQ